ncbi:Crp/Fnr family transcriptional regulator [Rhodoferax sp.]|uniref:Crp/Fnr family transcriptional regulator n=1 Tax=Rhodoferax sp. TaxID=50421 RepID=UPI0025D1CBD6|nr:Crp/Fnr family transcriptional regulator [Rhodoferax sp.]
MPFKAKAPAAMMANPWFAGLSARHRHALLAAGEPLHLRAGEMLYRQGDAPGGFFGIVSGSFKVSTLREDGKEGILVVIEAGNWLGETSLFDGLQRPHDVTALGPAEVLVVGPPAFDSLMASPAFARAMCVLLTSRVRLLYSLVEDTMLRAISTRVARRLLALARGDSAVLKDSRSVLPVSQEALAMMLGVTRQTLSKELKALVRDGVVRIGYGRLEILSLAALEARGRG